MGQELAKALNAPLLAARFRGIRNRRYPQFTKTTVRTLAANFPDRYVTLLKRTAKRFSIEQNLMVAPRKRVNPRAVSPVGALGLMQLMPTTAAGLLGISVESEKFDPNNILQPSTNVYLGCRYFKKMLKNFGGKVEYAWPPTMPDLSREPLRKRGEVPLRFSWRRFPTKRPGITSKSPILEAKIRVLAASPTSGPPAQSKDQRVQNICGNSLKRHKTSLRLRISVAMRSPTHGSA